MQAFRPINSSKGGFWHVSSHYPESAQKIEFANSVFPGEVVHNDHRSQHHTIFLHSETEIVLFYRCWKGLSCTWAETAHTRHN